MKRKLAMLLALAMVLSLTAIAPIVSADEQPELTTLKILGFERKVAQNALFAERDTQAVWQEAEKMFAANGIAFDFEIVADQDQYRTTIQTRLASGYDLPDLCYVGTMTDAEALELVDVGTLIAINPIMERTKGNAYNFYYGGEGERARNTLSDADGNFYWLPRIQQNLLEGQEAGTSMGVCIRLDWLNELGLPVPTSLNEYTEALRAFQENDMNKNGVKDEVAALDTSVFSSGMNYWFGIVNAEDRVVGVNVTEGTVESPWYSPNIKEYFAYVKSLVDEGLLYAEKIGSDASLDLLQNENKVSAVYYYPVGTYIEMPIRAAGFDDAYYIGIEPFDAVDGTKGFYSEETPYLVYMKYCVTNAAEDKLDAVAAYYDTIYSPEFIDLMDWGVEGKSYKVEDGQKVRLTIAKAASELWDEGALGFDALARFFFPTVYHNERLEEISVTEKNGWKEKADYELATKSYQPRTPNDNTGYYALPTPEELEVLSEYTTDLVTYSRELAANLSLGRASLDDWDTYIEELKALGLDEVIAARQAQLDRRNGK